MKFPEIIKQQQREGVFQLELFIDPELFFFKGHFDDAPIIPGVAQTYWALEFAKNSYPDLQHATVQSITALKFQQVIQPHDTVILNFSYDQNKQSLSFSFIFKDSKYSSGKINLSYD